MSSLVSRLKEITHNSIQVNVKDRKTKLIEPPTDNSVSGMEIEVGGLPEEVIVLKLDRVDFKGLSDGEWNKCCDFVIVSSGTEPPKVLFVELKLSSAYLSTAKKQLSWSKPRFEYLLSICRKLGKEISTSVDDKYVCLYRFASERMDKYPTRPYHSNYRDSYKGVTI